MDWLDFFEEAGFTVEQLAELEGYYGTLSYEMSVATQSLPIRPAHYGGGPLGFVAAALALFFVPLSYVLSQFYAHLDRRVKYTQSGHCKETVRYGRNDEGFARQLVCASGVTSDE
jgi:hypothetical protein